MKKVLIIATVFCTILLVHSCRKKKEAPVIPVTPLEFNSLTANPVIVESGETATLTAVTKGDNLSYQWVMSHGDLFGSGNTVVFGAAPCCVGINTVSCTVTDGSSSLTQTVDIEVLPGHGRKGDSRKN